MIVVKSDKWVIERTLINWGDEKSLLNGWLAEELRSQEGLHESKLGWTLDYQGILGISCPRLK